MKKTIKGFLLGVIITTLLMSTAFGVEIQKKIDVVFNKVYVRVNGEAVKGDNILYKGTTYLPLRAISEMLDKNVTWIQLTNEVFIQEKLELPSGKLLSEKEALDIIINAIYGHKKPKMELVEDPAGGTISYKIGNNFYIAIDHYDEEKQAYVIHQYQIIMDDEEWGHTATSAWYSVSAKDGVIKDGMPF